MFSVCMLFYGDYPELARRLLESLRVHNYVQDFRIGLNAIGPETRDLVYTWGRGKSRQTPTRIYEAENFANLGKYPLMRAMLRDQPLAPRTMWFDDDSYLDPTCGLEWWDQAVQVSDDAVQVGAVHSIRQRHHQHTVICQQPWYTGLPVGAKHLYTFATGGWWIAQSEFLLKWDYPFPALHHNGGDSILGELIRQQRQRLVRFSAGTQCHCESCAAKGLRTGVPVVHINVGGRKGRRGLGVTDEQYVWADGQAQPSLEHQNFNLRVLRYAV